VSFLGLTTAAAAVKKEILSEVNTSENRERHLLQHGRPNQNFLHYQFEGLQESPLLRWIDQGKIKEDRETLEDAL
jgi:hypothetical protein